MGALETSDFYARYTDKDGDRVDIRRGFLAPGDLMIRTSNNNGIGNTAVIPVSDVPAFMEAVAAILPKPCTHCDGKGVV